MVGGGGVEGGQNQILTLPENRTLSLSDLFIDKEDRRQTQECYRSGSGSAIWETSALRIRVKKRKNKTGS